LSRYTHIQALLDMFIFQNPIQPVTYFEYYSEKLKKYYHTSQPYPDLNFLKNIEKNVHDKITDIYKQTWVNYLLEVKNGCKLVKKFICIIYILVLINT